MSLRRASTRGPRPLDVYKKLTILRTADDCIVDEGGSKQSINANDLERDVEVAPVVRAKKLNIPIPVGNMAEDYETRIAGGYEPPVSYIRLVKKVNETDDVMEYVLEHSDVKWLQSCGHPANMLNEDRLEKMIDELEKATGVNAVITQSAAEVVLNAKLGITASSASREVIADVYQYWLSKRAKVKKPLLRSLWPVTAVSDTDPHHVFRAIVKERYKLRRNRKNDMESFRRMQQLRRECEIVRDLVDLIRHREKVQQVQVAVGGAAFEQQLREQGFPNNESIPPIDVDEIREILVPPLLGEDATVARLLRTKKLKVDTDGQEVDEESKVVVDSSRDGSGAFRVDATIRPPPTLPSFMDSFNMTNPIASSSSTSSSDVLSHHLSSWPTCLKPRIRHYDGSENFDREPITEANVKFECRGRMGRGGRIVIDRIPTKRQRSDPLSHPSCQLQGPTRINSLCRIPLNFPKTLAPEFSFKSLRYTQLPPPSSPPLNGAAVSTANGSSQDHKAKYDKRKFEEIYDRSDSEDEELRPLGAPLAQGASIKFQVLV